MYHISNDKRAYKSAKLILDGLLACSKKKNFHEISISDIQRESTVSRSTFYRLFDTIDDVLKYWCDNESDLILSKNTILAQNGSRAFVLEFIKEFLKQKDWVKLLAESDNLSMLARFHRRHYKEIMGIFNFNAGIQDKADDYMINIISMIIPVVLETWVSHGQIESAEEIYEYTQKVLKSMSTMMDTSTNTKQKT